MLKTILLALLAFPLFHEDIQTIEKRAQCRRRPRKLRFSSHGERPRLTSLCESIVVNVELGNAMAAKHAVLGKRTRTECLTNAGTR